jgi:hypothetical protein
MALQRMTVAAKKGAGESLDAEFPYQFYAKKQISDKKTVVVNMVMPIGGKENGFYRYPKADESILVDDDGKGDNASYYLMGYLPSAGTKDNNFLTNDKTTGDKFTQEKNTLLDEEGMVLRYEQTGKVTPSAEDAADRYSEIGFYRRETQWQSTDKGYKDVTGDDPVYPKIDQINILSTGDIHTTAKNHQLLKANRFELLAGCDDINHKIVGVIDEETGEYIEDLPLGDNPGDDSELHKGDVHIRAGNRVVIKAEEEIRLQVGRTVLTITDEGFNVTARQTCSNFATAYDATLELQPRSGISMAGKNVEISAGYELNVTDAMGGSLASTLGVVEIKGRELQIEAYDKVEFVLLEAGLICKLAQACTSVGLFKTKPTRTDIMEYYELANEFFLNVVEKLKDVADAIDDGGFGDSANSGNPSAGGTSAGGSGSPGATSTGGSSAGGSGSPGAASTGGSSAGGSGSPGAASAGGSSAGGSGSQGASSTGGSSAGGSGSQSNP